MKSLLKIALVTAVLVNLTACVEYNDYGPGYYVGPNGYRHHHHVRYYDEPEVVVSSGYVDNYPRHVRRVDVIREDGPVYVSGRRGSGDVVVSRPRERAYVNRSRPTVSVTDGVVADRNGVVVSSH